MKYFSVLMPVYHGDDFQKFTKAVDSILNNSLQAQEIVIVRDGPVERSVERLLSALEVNRDNIFIERLEVNSGIVKALNHGLSKCSHEYIIRADADDENHIDRFRCIIQCLDAGYDLVGSQIVEKNGDVVVGKRKVPTKYEDILKFLRYRNPFNHMSVGFRKSKVEALGGYPDVFKKEDYALWIKMIGTGARVTNLSETLVTVSGGAAMHARRGGWKYLLSEISIARLLLKYKLQNMVMGVLTAGVRVLTLSIPTNLKKFVYSTFLRTKR